MSRGRPKENDTPVLKYTQKFKHLDGSITTWVWDKTINKNGPISVETEYKGYGKIDKLLKEQADINNKYLAKEGERKPRILKIDKQRLEQIEIELEQEYKQLN